MGNILEVLRNNSFRKNSSIILGVTLTKLRDFHACFKSICDHFSMDLNEFEHIFGAGESDFVIWDSDNNGLIDSLELFAGISIFSDTKFEDKARFLFDIFDFNEVQKISELDVQFLIYCCVNSTYKIFSISNDVEMEQISTFAKECFGHLESISVSNLIKISKDREEIKTFFEITKTNRKYNYLKQFS